MLIKRMLGVILSSIVPVLVTSCGVSEAPLPAAPSGSSASGIQLSMASEPGRSGVFRTADQIGFFVYDTERGLLSLHGSAIPFAQVCAGTPPAFEFVDIQTVETASGLHALFKGKEHPVLIYPAGPFNCGFLATALLLAAGPARLVRVDNDLFGDPRGTNAFGWNANGILDDTVNGGTLRYSEVVKVLFKPQSGEIVERNIDIRLH